MLRHRPHSAGSGLQSRTHLQYSQARQAGGRAAELGKGCIGPCTVLGSGLLLLLSWGPQAEDLQPAPSPCMLLQLAAQVLQILVRQACGALSCGSRAETVACCMAGVPAECRLKSSTSQACCMLS